MPKILVADDEPHILKLVKFTLENHGFEILEAENGLAAIELAKRDKPDMIILDVMMPLMSGYDACMKLKEIPETKNIPIVILSAKTQQYEISKGMEMGADAYLNKPFTPKELLAEVEKVLKGIHSERGDKC